MRKAVIFIVIFLIIGGVTVFIIRQRSSIGKDTSLTSIPLVTEENVSTEEWRTYENDLGYRIKMPPNILIDTDVGKRSVHLIPDVESGEFGPANFIYISVIDRENINDSERVYNYNYSQFLKLMDMDIGEKRSVVPKKKNTPDIQSWFTYERLENVSINGEDARVFLNRKPWEFPLGVAELRYVVPTEETIYILGGYFGGDISVASLTGNDVKKVIATFRIL